MITKQEFIEQRTEAIQIKYKELRQQKMKRPEAFKLLGQEFDLSPASLSSIVSRYAYQKPIPRFKNT